nr:MAG TPA: hypothetical protein [Caudoviricetes sp.]
MLLPVHDVCFITKFLDNIYSPRVLMVLGRYILSF